LTKAPDNAVLETAAVADAQSGVTLATAISDRIRAEILSGKKKPGTKLRLEEIKTEFGVSWSPIREGLSRLLAEGLVTTADQRGFRVAPVSKAHLADIIRTRSALESMALAASIERGDDAWEADLLAAHHRLGKFETRRWEGRELDQWEVWHRTYHDALIRGCGSPILLQFCSMLHDMNYRYRRLFLTTHEPDRDVASEHRAITEAALARELAKACRLLESHIERTGRNILQSMSD
jgi:DNA-binding GntR family transcriptional regulator